MVSIPSAGNLAVLQLEGAGTDGLLENGGVGLVDIEMDGESMTIIGP